MTSLIPTVNTATMSSIDLLEIINQARLQHGEAEVRRNQFNDRIVDELEGAHYKTFVVTNANCTQSVGFDLTHDQCMLVAMRESKAVRRNVLEQLKAKAPKLPQTMAQALRLAAEQAEQLEQQQAALALAAPKVEFVDRYVEASGLKGFREVCKLIKANEARFREFVLGKKIMYRLGGALTAHQQHIDAGRFEVRAGISDVNDHAFTSTKFTAKGIDWIAGEWAKYQLHSGGEA